jgi:protein KRI1
MPTRFKYVPVQPQNFALTPVEILLATDAELNEYMSVKKYAPYRKDARWDSTRGDRLKELKQKVSERGGAGMKKEGAGLDEHQGKKRKGKKERMKMKAAAPEGQGEEDEEMKVGTSKKGDEVEAGRDGLKRKRQFDDEPEDRESGGTGKRKRRRSKKKDDPSQS